MSRQFVQYEDAPTAVRAVYDEVRKVRGFDHIPSYYRALAADPKNLERVWNSARSLFERTKIDPLAKEMIAIAVFAVLGAEYCLAKHIEVARKLGMDDETFGELTAAIGVFAESAVTSRALGLTATDD